MKYEKKFEFSSESRNTPGGRRVCSDRFPSTLKGLAAIPSLLSLLSKLKQ
jgi:hypothetical protein